MPLEQTPCALHRVRDAEEPTNQLLDPRQGPPLVSPAVCERSTLQLPLQPGDLGIAQSRTAGRPLRGDTSRPALTPLPPPPFHRSFRHPKSISDGPVPVPGFEPSHRIQPYPLPGCPLGVGQAAALRVPHSDSSTAQRAQRSAERPDITQSSSVHAPGVRQGAGRGRRDLEPTSDGSLLAGPSLTIRRAEACVGRPQLGFLGGCCCADLRRGGVGVLIALMATPH